MIYVYKNNLDKLVYLPKGFKIDLESNEMINASAAINLISSYFEIDKKDVKIVPKNILTKNCNICMLIEIENKQYLFDRVNQCIINAIYVNFNHVN